MSKLSARSSVNRAAQSVYGASASVHAEDGALEQDDYGQNDRPPELPDECQEGKCKNAASHECPDEGMQEFDSGEKKILTMHV